MKHELVPSGFQFQHYEHAYIRMCSGRVNCTGEDDNIQRQRWGWERECHNTDFLGEDNHSAPSLRPHWTFRTHCSCAFHPPEFTIWTDCLSQLHTNGPKALHSAWEALPRGTGWTLGVTAGISKGTRSMARARCQLLPGPLFSSPD